MTLNKTRRVLLKAAAASPIVSTSFYGIPSLAGYAATPALRRNASLMESNDPILRGYRRAVSRMRRLPDTNPCSWFYQAAIHGTRDNRDLIAWNTCHTDRRFFWAWHRMYLYWFERIVRKYSGMYDWAVPYWDWANQSQRALPAPFREPGSALFDNTRNSNINTGSLLSTALGTSVTGAMMSQNYFTTQGGISSPHGTVHVSVGGNMSSTRSAAQDPIFWLHHSNVDRLWNLWLAQGGRSNPVGDELWRESTYTFFDECCEKVTMDGCDVLRAAQQLGYAYEEEPTQVNQYCPIDWTIRFVEILEMLPLASAFILADSSLRFDLSEISRNPGQFRQLLDTAQNDKERLVLTLRDVEAEKQPAISWEVYLTPKGNRPSPKQLVGLVSLFSAGLKDREHHYSPAEFIFPINEALKTSSATEWEVVFVPTNGMENNEGLDRIQLEAKVRIGEMSIGIDKPAPLPPADEQEKLRRRAEEE